jgi:hypothetical protein
MMIVIDAVNKRLSSSYNNNNQTRTYFRFSIAKRIYYFGIYVPCIKGSCVVCPNFVTRHGSMCWTHWKRFCQESTPTPPSHVPKFTYAPKWVRSNRLGIEYVKKTSYSQRYASNFIVCSDFRRFSDKKHQVERFTRLTSSPTSNNYRRLITADKNSTSQRCKHNTGPPMRLSLTSVVDDFFRAFPLPEGFGHQSASSSAPVLSAPSVATTSSVINDATRFLSTLTTSSSRSIPDTSRNRVYDPVQPLPPLPLSISSDRNDDNPLPHSSSSDSDSDDSFGEFAIY